MVVQVIKYIYQGEEQSITCQWMLWFFIPLHFQGDFIVQGLFSAVYCQRRWAWTHIHLSKVWLTWCNLSALISSCKTKQYWEQVSPQTKSGTLSLAPRNWGDLLTANCQHWGRGTSLSRCPVCLHGPQQLEAFPCSPTSRDSSPPVLLGACTHTQLLSAYFHTSLWNPTHSLIFLTICPPSGSKPKGTTGRKPCTQGISSPLLATNTQGSSQKSSLSPVLSSQGSGPILFMELFKIIWDILFKWKSKRKLK